MVARKARPADPVPATVPREFVVFVRRRGLSVWERIGRPCTTVDDAKATAEGATDADIDERIVVELVAQGLTTLTCEWS